MKLAENAELIFNHRDPEKIGNGLHDYDVYCGSDLIGTFHGDAPKQVGAMPPEVMFYMGGKHGVRYSLGINMEQITHCQNNEEIFALLTPHIIRVYNVWVAQQGGE